MQRTPSQRSVLVLTDAAHVAREASARIARVLAEAQATRGLATLALSGGSTPNPTYQLLAAAREVDWKRVHVFWVDERMVPPDHERSNYRGAENALLEPAGIPPEHIHRMPGEDRTPEAGASDAQHYEALLRQIVGALEPGTTIPRIDAMVLGLGDDGHTASLFPHEKGLQETSRLVLYVPATPTREARLTLAPPALLAARNVFVLVTGETKAQALARVRADAGPLEETPARLLRDATGEVLWLVDDAAVTTTRETRR